jgi:hypothetical protein
MTENPGQIPDGPDLQAAAAAEYPELRAPAAPSQQPAPGYEFPPGTPAQVPADFGAAQEQQLATQLTAEEIAEFRALRAEKKARDLAAAEEAKAAAARLSPPTHHVHLAGGQVVDGSSIETHWAGEDGTVHAVAGAYPMAEFATLL